MTDAHLHPASHPTDRLLGPSPAMAALRAQIRHLASFDTVGNPHVPTILLQGETGTGKGLVARVMHDSGPRAPGPFIEVNCAAIPDTMLEAELFGFEPGAFTDAKRAKVGLFEAASGGTLFLDEIDALPLVLQGKLLTALETKRVRRLGAVREHVVDVKLSAATNAVLPEAVAAGRFRADVYHRVAVVVIGLPPLRERGADILVLAQGFLQHYTAAHGVPAKRLTAEAEAWLNSYAWPGNVRELSHVMERVSLLHVGDDVDPTTLGQLCTPPLGEPLIHVAPLDQASASEGVLPAEIDQIRQALAQTGGNVARAARLLGVSRDTVRYRMQRFGITRPQAGSLSAPAPLRAPTGGVPRSPSAEKDWEGSASAASAEVLAPLPAQGEGKESTAATAVPGAPQADAAIEAYVATPAPAWEQKPVVVLALELTWPDAAALETWSYDPWTEHARWQQVIVDKVQGFGGLLLQRTPGLLTWLFGVPETLEQLPQRAVHSALAIRQMVVDASIPRLVPHPEVRMAVHLGAVRVDRQAADPTARLLPIGDTLVVPVRLLGQAATLDLLITPEVGRLVDGWVSLEVRPLHLRPGNATRVDGYAVLGVSPGREAWSGRRHPMRSPFVGRERELALLDGALAQVKAGRGQMVTLIGAPGMGKSRLLHEFRLRITGQRMRYAAGQCLAYGSGIPYLPVLDLLRGHCGIVEGDPSETLIAKMRLALEPCGADLVAELPLLLDLIGVAVETDRFAGLSTDGRRARTFETLWQLLLPRAPQEPLVLTVDNLQWIDPTSEAFLAGLIDRLASVPLLVLTTARPGYRPPWGDRSQVMQLTLSPLDPDASRQVVHSVLADRPLTPPLEQQLLDKGDGNPFFLEELAYTVREQEGRPAALAVPNTIQAVLAARIDRLPQEEKHLLQTAAVIGLTVPFSLLQAIAEAPAEALQRRLTHLQTAEFLYETRLFPEREYTFKHALTHDMAYGSLLSDRRRALHAQIVGALEALAGERVADQIERLAHHALRGEVWDKAVAHGRQAGEKAMARSAHREAVGFFEQALSALPHVPETADTRVQAIDLRLALRDGLWPLGELRQILAYLQQALSLAEALGDEYRLGWVTAYLAGHFGQICEPDPALASGQRALAIAGDLEDVGLTVTAQHYLGTVFRSLGDYPRAIEFYRKNVASLHGELLRERFGMHDLVSVSSRYSLAYCFAECGIFTEGITPAEEGVRIAETADHPYSRVLAYYAIGFRALRKGDLYQAIPMLEKAVDLGQRAQIRLLVPLVAAPLGAAYGLAGRITDALPLLEQAVDQAVAMGYMLDHALRLVWLGEAYLSVGRLEEAITQAQRALEFSMDHQERGREAYARRLLGEIAARRQPPEADQAEAYYRHALILAEELSMRPLVAHCHRGLGTLYRDTGRRAEARSELSAASTLYRAMDMTFWLPQSEDALVHLRSRGS